MKIFNHWRFLYDYELENNIEEEEEDSLSADIPDIPQVGLMDDHEDPKILEDVALTRYFKLIISYETNISLVPPMS